MDIWYARVWVVNHIIKIQIKGNIIHSNPPYTIQGWKNKYSWWYWFKHKYPRLTTILLGLEAYVTQGCNSSYQNLIFLYNQHNCPTYYICNCDEMGIQYGQEWKVQVFQKKVHNKLTTSFPSSRNDGWWSTMPYML